MLVHHHKHPWAVGALAGCRACSAVLCCAVAVAPIQPSPQLSCLGSLDRWGWPCPSLSSLQVQCPGDTFLWLWTQKSFPGNSHCFSSTRQKESLPPQVVPLSVKTQCPFVLTWRVGSCLPKTFPEGGAEGGILSFTTVPNWRRALSAGTLHFLLRNSSGLWKT